MNHGKWFLTVATTLFAGFLLASEAPAAEPPSGGDAEKEAEPEPYGAWARRGLYFGPSFGVAKAESTDFAWGLNVDLRAFRYFSFQMAYFNLGKDNDGSGDLDGAYFGGAPTLPIAAGFSIFGQGGYAVSDGDDAAAYGGGVLYDLPIDLVGFLTGGLTLRADYKRFEFDNTKDGNAWMAGIVYRFGTIGTP